MQQCKSTAVGSNEELYLENVHLKYLVLIIHDKTWCWDDSEVTDVFTQTAAYQLVYDYTHIMHLLTEARALLQH